MLQWKILIFCTIVSIKQKRIFDFRTEVAESGNPTQGPPPPKKKRVYLPTNDVRYDQVSHWCEFSDHSERKKCKMQNCNSQTQSNCVKCKLNLCNTSQKNCFFNFHNKKN